VSQPLVIRLLGAALPALLLTAAAAAPARAQIESREGIALQDQILELKHELEELRSQGGGASNGGGDYAAPPASASGAIPSDIATQLLDRVTRLEDEVRRLRGRIDEVDNARQQAEADLGKQIGDLQFRLNAGGAGGLGAPTPPRAGTALAPQAGTLVGPPIAAPSAAAPPLRRTPEMTLQAGTLALGRRDYVTAEQDAREVLAGAKGPRTTDALYLLAQALAGQRNYSAAAVAYDDTYNRGARGYRAQDSLLGLANSLSALGDKKAACETLAKLRAEFPSTRPDLREPVSLARARNGCR
jgi:TolA-binding protein